MNSFRFNRRPLPGSARFRQAMSHVTPRHVKNLSIITSVGMFIVVVLGTLVTTTGSAHGCGNSWPLCKGKFIPSFAFTTAIEFSHRAVTGLETILVMLMTFGVLWFWRSRREVRFLAPVMVIFLLLQAALGALAVMYPESPEILAAHFGISLISFASIVVTTLLIHEFDSTDALRDRQIAVGFRRLVFGITAYSYVVVYLGAYVRHKGAELACTDWPLCQSSLFPNLDAGRGYVMAHRIGALLLALGITWMFLWARRIRSLRPDLYTASLWALGLVIAQALEGGIVVYSKIAGYSTLAHAGLVALLFSALCYLCFKVLPRPATVRTATPESIATTKYAQTSVKS